MYDNNKLLEKAKLICLLLAINVICSCTDSVKKGMIIISGVPQNEVSESVWDFSDIQGAKLLAWNEGMNGEPVNLTKDFYSALSPQVSYNGEKVLFSAKKEKDSPWQIWEMKLNSQQAQQITNFEEDCVSPAYLPGNRLIFSRLMVNKSVKKSYVLFTGNLEGTRFNQITFSPQSFTGTSILKEGRVLSTVKQVYPEVTESKLMVLRPDGTKNELLYKAKHGNKQLSKAKESSDGQILFVEYNAQQDQSEIVALDYSNPSKDKRNLSLGLKGEFYFVAPYQKKSLLTSYSVDGKNSVLSEFNLESMELNDLFTIEYRIIDVAIVEAIERPRNLPSDVKSEAKSGLLMCQNINYMGLKSVMGEIPKEKATKVEVLGIDKSMGIVDVEEDGSFYIKIEADVPFRLQTISDEGEVVNGPGSWYYIRPNERRGCVGCHTGSDISPHNRQPLAVKKNPVILDNSKTIN